MAKKSIAKKSGVKKVVSKKAAVNKAVAEIAPNEVMAQQLAFVLSDTYVLAIKVHGYHWNVMGPNFIALHTFFEEQYKILILAADVLAERIRALGLMPDGSMDSFLQNTVIIEAGTKALTAEAMLADLLESYNLLKERVVEAEDLADEIDDLVTQGLLVDSLVTYEKTMWMIRSHLV